MLTLHERHQWNMVPMKYLGASVFGVNVLPGFATSYEITAKIRYLQDRHKMRCSSNNSEKMDECLRQYFDKNMNCKLPWRKRNNWNQGIILMTLQSGRLQASESDHLQYI